MVEAGTSVFAALPVLETERLTLRPIRRGDEADAFAYGADPEVSRYTTWERHRTIDDACVFVDWVLGEYAQGRPAPWGIVLRDDGHLIGACGVSEWRPEHARAEIGYVLARPYWGRGYATEAVRAVLAFGFRELKLNRIEAVCAAENAASERVLQKVGMRCEGVLRRYMVVKGRSLDWKIYSVLADEFTATAQPTQR